VKDVVYLKQANGNFIEAKIIKVFRETRSYELESSGISFPLFLSEQTLLKLKRKE
jgi:hypothetical protein